MSTAENDFRARLASDSAVAALVGKRIAQNSIPEGATLPYVVFTTTTTPFVGIDGTHFANQVAITCECWAANALAADVVADAVEQALASGPAGQATVTTRGTGFDGDLGLDATVLTIEFWTD